MRVPWIGNMRICRRTVVQFNSTLHIGSLITTYVHIRAIRPTCTRGRSNYLNNTMATKYWIESRCLGGFNFQSGEKDDELGQQHLGWPNIILHNFPGFVEQTKNGSGIGIDRCPDWTLVPLETSKTQIDNGFLDGSSECERFWMGRRPGRWRELSVESRALMWPSWWSPSQSVPVGLLDRVKR